MLTCEDLQVMADVIDSSRNLLCDVKVKVEVTLNYFFAQLYGKVVLTMCEIYTLLNNNYPEGAMALARNIFEAEVIMLFLYSHKEDKLILERFWDDYDVKTRIDKYKYMLNYEKDNKQLEELKGEIEELKEKYKSYLSDVKRGGYFSQYWWAGKGMSFRKIAEEVGAQDNFLYDIACYRVHAGITGASIRFDTSENGILIGTCEEGKELPFIFALGCFYSTTKLFYEYNNIDCNSILENIDNCLNRVLSNDVFLVKD